MDQAIGGQPGFPLWEVGEAAELPRECEYELQPAEAAAAFLYAVANDPLLPRKARRMGARLMLFWITPLCLLFAAISVVVGAAVPGVVGVAVAYLILAAVLLVGAKRFYRE